MNLRWFALAAAVVAVTACEDESMMMGPEPLDPDDAPVAGVDRFSSDAGNLFVRTDANGLPGPNEPIDFDQAPFITQGLGPAGEVVRYYNFDVMPEAPAPIFVLFREGEDEPVDGQLNIVDVKPGDAGYSDFWLVTKVTVPSDYVANTATSLEDLQDAGYAMETTDMIVNCPIVPEGSTADLRYGDGASGLVRGWYDDSVVFYFDFSEKEGGLHTTSDGLVPTSPIYVAFNINPGEDGGGPPSGFMTEAPDSPQTHNVAATIPTDADYSPFWLVNAYDNADFDMVMDLMSAEQATILGAGVALVNCPIVSVE